MKTVEDSNRKGIVPSRLRKKQIPLGGVSKSAVGAKGSGIATGPGADPNLLYQGGPIVVNPQVHAIYLGDWTSAANQGRITQLNQFITDFLNSSYMDVLSQYGIGTSGTFVNSITVADTSNSLVDVNFHTVIQTAINNNQLPEPTANSSVAFIIYLDDNKVVTDEQICEANGNFGYHSSFTTTAGNPCYYAIVPSLNDACVSTVCGNLPPGYTCSINQGATTQVQRQTQVSSHELSEMFTDPQVAAGNLAWNDNDFSDGEIGDLCNGQAGTITVGANTWNVQLMYSKWDDLTTNGSSPCVASEPGPLPSLLPQFYFTVNKDTYGVDEVTDQNFYQKAFWLTLEGYSFSQLGSTVPQLTGSFETDSDLQITPNSVNPVLELPGDQWTPQRISFYYDVKFNSPPFQNFPLPNGQAITKLLHATIAMPQFTPSADVEFQLIAGADPYFTNVDTTQNNAFYLSQDLRVFTITPGIPSTQISGVPPLSPPDVHTPQPEAGFSYIQSLLNHLNSQYNNPVTDVDPFLASSNVIPDPNNALFNDSNVTPTTPDPSDSQHPFTNYNFAVARVRLTGSGGPTTEAANVKVFFRLFITQTNDTDYQTSTTYLSSVDSQNLPLSPSVGTDGAGNIVTIPFFATGNYSSVPVNSDYSAPSVNNGPIEIPTGRTSIWAYYGCFLNFYDTNNLINQTAVNSLLTGTHNCLVAQIADDAAPIPSPVSGIVASPESSDKLAQRNLQVTRSENPQSQATHRVPQTFDIRPSPPLAARPGQLLDYPDELMIEWGNTPIGSIAYIYWPQVSASTVLQLASRIYTTQLLSAADGNTIRSIVNDGVTYVPIPPGTGPNFAGLFTIDLPLSVTRGQEFNIVVRRITTRRFQKRAVNQPPAPKSSGVKAGGVQAAIRTGETDLVLKNWRYVVGTFQVKIPVTTKEVMLSPEENTLAIMKWRLQSMRASNRWYPVLQRYISYVAARVDGLGGDANKIPPSPNGAPVGGKAGDKETLTYSGKVPEVVFDCFGEFEGFALECCHADLHYFKSREKAIGELLLRVCKERSSITLHVRKQHPADILSIIVRG
jgi:hypothetical protein